jgi:uncharacterized protein (TIGR02145 family)
MNKSELYLLCLVVVIMPGCNDDPSSGPPLAPVSLAAHWISPTQIEVSWSDVSTDEDGFKIERRAGIGGLFTKIGEVPANTTSYVDEGLLPEAEYFYWVTSFNINGSSSSEMVTVTPSYHHIPLQVTTEIFGKIGMSSAMGSVSYNVNTTVEVSTQGLIWSTLPDPTFSLETKTMINSNMNSSLSLIGPLKPSTEYHVKAYVANEIDTVYWNEITFTTTNEPIFKPGSGVTDVEGNSYKTVLIGDQEWMAENLRSMTYSNGENIVNVTDSDEWSQLTSAAWCHYDNNPQFDQLQGKLYNWYAASNVRNVCPNGWHLPTLGEWTELQDFLGGGILAGVRMKSPLPSWEQPDLSTNESGFSAVHSGTCVPCQGLYSTAEWWSATMFPKHEFQLADEVYTVRVGAGTGPGIGGSTPVVAALSVRCVKN